MPRPPKRGGADAHAPCSSYTECRHAKHGYTRRDRPDPRPGKGSHGTKGEPR